MFPPCMWRCKMKMWIPWRDGRGWCFGKVLFFFFIIFSPLMKWTSTEVFNFTALPRRLNYKHVVVGMGVRARFIMRRRRCSDLLLVLYMVKHSWHGLLLLTAVMKKRLRILSCFGYYHLQRAHWVCVGHGSVGRDGLQGPESMRVG